MSTKTITMTVRDGSGGHINYTQVFDRDCSWPSIAYQFHKFLLAMGYNMEGEEVGSDVEAFVSATKNLEQDY